MGSVSEWLQMGGYAGFVWPSYGIAAAVLIGVLIHSVRASRGNQTTLETLRRATREGKEDTEGEA